jgi:hypothetical protein
MGLTKAFDISLTKPFSLLFLEGLTGATGAAFFRSVVHDYL